MILLLIVNCRHSYVYDNDDYSYSEYSDFVYDHEYEYCSLINNVDIVIATFIPIGSCFVVAVAACTLLSNTLPPFQHGPLRP